MDFVPLRYHRLRQAQPPSRGLSLSKAIFLRNMENNEIILYQPEETVKIEVRLENETVWLTQRQMAELFGTQRQAITKHLKNIFDTKELDRDSTSSILELLQREGARLIKRNVELFNLDVIISVGFRVNTTRGIQFRQWANRVLKDHLLKGYSVNQRFERLEQRVSATEDKIDFFVRTSLPPVEGVFFDGQMLEPFGFVNQLIRSARNRIVLIDNYVDETVLLRLAERDKNVAATIYTQQMSPSFQLALSRHNAQYAPVDVHVFTRSHDRFLILDDTVYHIGASIKDLGKRWFAFSKMLLDAEELLGKINHRFTTGRTAFP